MPYDPRLDYATVPTVAAADLINIEKGVVTAANSAAGSVWLDDPEFANADDDVMLANTMSYTGAQTHPPAIRIGNSRPAGAPSSDYNFSGSIGKPHDGWRFVGPNQGSCNAELADDNTACRVNLTYNGNWINLTGGGDVWNGLVSGIAFNGSANTTFMASDASTVWHGSHIRDCGFKNFKTVLGTQAQKLLMTTCTIDGYFQVQGTYNGGIHIGGSDNKLFLGGALMDASQAYNTAGSAAGQFHMWFDGLDNSCVGTPYITSTGLWGGIRITGVQYNATPTSNFGMVTFLPGAVIEGHNATDPCFGAVMRIEGGLVKIRDCYIGRAMSDPTAMTHSPTDAGVIHQTGGYVLLDGPTYGRATSVAETVPMFYQAGGTARIRNASVATHGGTWSGLPRVQSVGGTMSVDDTVTVV